MDLLAMVFLAALEREQGDIIRVAAGARVGFQRVRGSVEDIPICPPDCPPVDPNPSDDAGAELPITYTIASLGGTPRYVAPGGGGTACTEASPCATVSQAHSTAVNGDPIIVRAGTYTNVGNTWSGTAWSSETFITKNGIKLYAYPGETVVFDGSQNIFASTWTTESALKYAAYTPRPCGNGFGITFCTEGPNDNVNGTDSVYPYNVGKWIDQVWVDGVKLQEMARKADITDTSFWVDRVNSRVYLTAATKDAAISEIAVCNRGDFITVNGSDAVMSGFTVQRYCNSQARAAMIDVNAAADRFHMVDVVIDDGTMQMFMQGSASDPLEDVLIEQSTFTDANWMGVNVTYLDAVTFDLLRMTGMDPWNEFSSSPQAGAIKTSRVANSTVKNSYIANNRSQGIWYDQSNWNTHVFNNTFVNTGISGEDSTFFYEISDGLKFYNNTVISPIGIAVKVAGSGNVQILNNTIVGGKDAIGIYADSRSRLNCATDAPDGAGKTHDLSGVECGGFAGSDQWRASWASAPADLNWLTRVNVVQNNIFAYPTVVGLCGGNMTAACIARINNPANLALANMLPDGIVMDCNVYATNAGSLITHTNPSTTAFIGYTSLAAFTTAMAGAAPYPAEAIEAHGLAGVEYVNPDGTPTAALAALHASSFCSFPTDATMNATIPAGTKHYGATYH